MRCSPAPPPPFLPLAATPPLHTHTLINGEPPLPTAGTINVTFVGGNPGRARETNFGDWAADLLVAEAASMPAFEKAHGRVGVGLVNAGAIRADLEPPAVSYGAVLSAVPFLNTVAVKVWRGCMGDRRESCWEDRCRDGAQSSVRGAYPRHAPTPYRPTPRARAPDCLLSFTLSFPLPSLTAVRPPPLSLRRR